MPPPPTARLEFRRWTREDRDLAATLWCDPEVMRFLGGPYSQEELEARVERESASEVQYWLLFTRDGQFAGVCGLKPHKEAILEIGFQLLPRFWGAGYAYEAAAAVVDYAFDALHVKALVAGHHPHNDSSRRLLTKLGFTEIGTHHFARTGLEHPWWELRKAAHSSRT
ncbi:MAG TPA: GNAT family N-acetyltransferase [Thermoanaerobaculia bacterium]